jgi:hypothetical protein
VVSNCEVDSDHRKPVQIPIGAVSERGEGLQLRRGSVGEVEEKVNKGRKEKAKEGASSSFLLQLAHECVTWVQALPITWDGSDGDRLIT